METSKAGAVISIATVLLLGGHLLRRSPEPEQPLEPGAAQVETPEQADRWGFFSSIPETLIGDEAKHDSQMLSGLCDGVASIIELDGKRSSPKLRYAIHVFDLRTTALMACLSESPVEGGQKYPAFNDVVGGAFSEAFPDGDEELVTERRAEVVAMFRALASACYAASRR